jgi:threonine synthase
MTPSPEAATDAYRAFVQSSEIVGLIISGLAVAGVTAILVFFRKLIALPKQMIIVQAALFRVLRSNKVQGTALTTIARCQKEQKCNGDTENAIDAVRIDQEKTDAFLAVAALGNIEQVKEELKP